MLPGKCNLFEMVFGSNWYICQEVLGPCVLITKVISEGNSFPFLIFIASGGLQNAGYSGYGHGLVYVGVPVPFLVLISSCPL